MARETAAERVERRLREDTEFYSRSVLRIVNEEGVEAPFTFWPTQRKVDAVLEAQRRAGKPMRAIVLKSRRTGCSSYGMSKLTQRVTLKANRRALIVAQDKDTAGELFELCETFHARLPGPEDEPPAPEWLKPELAYRRNTEDKKLLHFGTRSEADRRRGNLGINSTLRIDTAKEALAGRGKTITDLWLTEVAFWQAVRGTVDGSSKMLSLMNAVFDRPDTLIVVESTANGHNRFKERWDRACRGEGQFAPIFLSWLDDWKLRLPFADADEMARFEERLGDGVWGKDERELMRRSMAEGRAREHVLEQLHWRREIGIPDKCDGDLDYFKQEYPSTPGEAFIASGRQVFSVAFVERVIERCQDTDPQAQVGLFTPSGVKTRQLMNGTLEVPTGALWVPRTATGFAATHDFWRAWDHPWKGRAVEERRAEDEPGYAPERLQEAGREHPGQYIVSVDASDGLSDGDWHAIQVLDHLTGEQAAVYRSRVDPDELGLQALLAGLYWNEAFIAVEVTGSHGLPIARWLWHKAGYRRVYRRRRPDSGKLKQEDRLGWDTNSRTKPLMIAEMKEHLRRETDGIRDLQTALEMRTSVEHDDGKLGADEGAYDDLLMSLMIGHAVRVEQPARRFDQPPPRAPQGRALPRKARL